jgi:hypothetical protein
VFDPFGLDRLADNQRALLLHCVVSGWQSSSPIYPATHDEKGGHWIDQLLQSGHPIDSLRAALLCLTNRLESLDPDQCSHGLAYDRPLQRTVEAVYVTSDRLRNGLAHLVRIPVFHFSDPCAKGGVIHTWTDSKLEGRATGLGGLDDLDLSRFYYTPLDKS